MLNNPSLKGHDVMLKSVERLMCFLFTTLGNFIHVKHEAARACVTATSDEKRAKCGYFRQSLGPL